MMTRNQKKGLNVYICQTSRKSFPSLQKKEKKKFSEIGPKSTIYVSFP